MLYNINVCHIIYANYNDYLLNYYKKNIKNINTHTYLIFLKILKCKKQKHFTNYFKNIYVYMLKYNE